MIYCRHFITDVVPVNVLHIVAQGEAIPFGYRMFLPFCLGVFANLASFAATSGNCLARWPSCITVALFCFLLAATCLGCRIFGKSCRSISPASSRILAIACAFSAYVPASSKRLASGSKRS